MIKPGEVQKIANKLGLRDTQIEKDYVIGWVLKGISNDKILSESLIFKGGTALRKIYFPEYRLSEDLDFTSKGKEFNSEYIDIHFNELLDWVKTEARIILNIQDKIIHQTGNYNFQIGYIGPLGGSGSNKSIKVDIANDEILCDDPIRKTVSNEYSDLNRNLKFNVIL